MVHVSTLTGAQHCNWESVRVERIGEGIERPMIVGDQLMICRLRLEPHVDMPAHEHPHEQITIIERGRVRFVVGDQERIAHAGRRVSFSVRLLAWRDHARWGGRATPVREDSSAGTMRSGASRSSLKLGAPYYRRETTDGFNSFSECGGSGRS
jgi:hypothetical protein